MNLSACWHTDKWSGDQQRSTFLAKRIDRQRFSVRSLRSPLAALGHQVQRQNVAREHPGGPSIIVCGNRGNGLRKRHCWQGDEDKKRGAKSDRHTNLLIDSTRSHRPRRDVHREDESVVAKPAADSSWDRAELAFFPSENVERVLFPSCFRA